MLGFLCFSDACIPNESHDNRSQFLSFQDRQTKVETRVKCQTDESKLDSKKRKKDKAKARTNSESSRRKPLRSCGLEQLGSAQFSPPIQSPNSNRINIIHSDFDENRSSKVDYKIARRPIHITSTARSPPIHRRQNCHGSDCTYCLSDITSNSVRNCCTLEMDSGSSTDREDQYPSICVTSKVKPTMETYHADGTISLRNWEPETTADEVRMNSGHKSWASHLVPKTPLQKQIHIVHYPTRIEKSDSYSDHSRVALDQRIPSVCNHTGSWRQEQQRQQQRYTKRDQMPREWNSKVTSMHTNTGTMNVRYIPVACGYRNSPRPKPKHTEIEKVPVTLVHEVWSSGNTN